MGAKQALSGVVLLLCLCAPGAVGKWFDPQHEYHYTYSARTNTFLDQELVTVIKLRIQSINESGDGTHLMKLLMDSFWQRDDQGHAVANPKRWNLARPFYFTSTENGLIEFVHVHPDDQEELIYLKKAVVSTLSAHVEDLEDHEYEAEYSREEPDHQGVNLMRYRVEKQGGKRVVTRQHSSTGRADRYHDKVLHFNEDNDLHQVFSNDFILIKDSSPPNIELKRQPYPGEKIIEPELDTGGVPDIHITSNSSLTLKNKIPKFISEHRDEKLKDLQKDSIVIEHKEVKTSDWEEAIPKIDKELNFLFKLNLSEATANRSVHMHNIDLTLRKLEDDALYYVAANYLNVSCGRAKVDKACMKARQLMIGAVGCVDTLMAQKVLLWFVLKRPRSKDEIEDVYAHLIKMSNPVPQLVTYLEKDCFGGKYEKHGTSTVEEMQRRTCLILGAVAKNLNQTDPMRAAQLMGHIASWIVKHSEKHGRSKRDVSMDGDDDDGYYEVMDQDQVTQSTYNEHVEMTRVILIEVLGNAGLKQSLDHMLDHARPDIGMSSWRRAALHSMRKYDCDESATSLLTSALHDSHAEVRDVAFSIYKNHPKAFELSEDQLAVVVARNISASSIPRNKRGLEDLLCKLNFYIEFPGVKWVKEVGSKKIGASAGLRMENFLSLNMNPLSGQFKINIDNEGWAEIHIGFLKIYFDIIRIKLCFKGHIRYDLNVLKDFGIDNPTDIISKFGEIVKSITDPIVMIVDDFVGLFTNFLKRGLFGMISDLIESTLEIDGGVKTMVATARRFREIAEKLTGPPWIRNIQLYALNMESILLNIQNSYVDFANAIGNDMRITIPSAIGDAFGSLQRIMEAIANILSDPLGVLNAMTSAVSQLRMSIAQLVQAKQRIENFFRRGKMPAFLEADDLQEYFENTKAHIAQVNQVIEETAGIPDTPVGVGPGGGAPNPALAERKVAQMLKTELLALEKIQADFVDTLKFFLDSYNIVMDTIKRMKRIHFNLMKVKGKADTIIKLIFGSPSEPFFPQIMLQNCANDCGNFPINDGGLDDGVRLSVDAGMALKSPVNGIAYPKGNNVVVIDCTDDAKSDWSIELTGVKASVPPNGKVVCANDTIGTVVKSECKPNSIHFVLRKKSNGKTADPRKWLRSPAPLPSWKQVCNDFKFVLLGVTLDAASIAKKKDQVKHVRKTLTPDLSTFANKEAELSAPYRHKSASPTMKALMAKKLAGPAARNANLQAFFKKEKIVTAGSDPEMMVHLFTMAQILEVMELGGKSATMTMMEGMITELIRQITTEGKLTFSDTTKVFHVRETLKNVGLDISQSNLAQLLETYASECTNIIKNLGPNTHNYAVVRQDCKRVRIGVQFTLVERLERQLLEMALELVSCDIAGGLKLQIGTLEEVHTCDATSPSMYAVDLGWDGVTTEVSFICTVTDGSFVIESSATICATSCLSVPITQGMLFGIRDDCATAVVDTADIRARIMAMNLKAFINELNTAGMPLEEVLDAVAEVNDAIYQTVRGVATLPCGRDQNAKEKMMADGLDFCIKGEYKAKPKDFTFFKIINFFVVGPIPIKLEFGAGGAAGVDLQGKLCFLSMKACATLTPWFGAKVYGEAAISIGIAEGGIRFTGFIMEVRVPGTACVVFKKFPLDITVTVDLELVPLSLVLSAYAALNLIVKKVTVFEANIWEYTMPTIKIRILEIGKPAKDKAPPTFQAVDKKVPVKNLDAAPKSAAAPAPPPAKAPPGDAPAAPARRKREPVTVYEEGCAIEQVRGRSYKQPAYLITAYEFDSESTPYKEFCIGTSPYNCDQEEWTEMKSNPTYVVDRLRDGVPLHWTVRLTDDDGNVNQAVCSLDTYDMTLPQGRCFWYPTSANRHNIRATCTAYEDSYWESTHFYGLGYAAGRTGDQKVHWKEFAYLDETLENSGRAGSPLIHFSDPQVGRLDSEPREIHEDVPEPADCAVFCNAIICEAFDWDAWSKECLLHMIVWSPTTQLRPSRKFSYYERNGAFDSWFWEFNDLPNIVHGQLFITNMHMTNSLGYEGYISSTPGTLLDYTPPFPDEFLVEEMIADEFVAVGCEASPLQRCHEVTEFENHRKVTASGLIFAGNERFVHTKYTSSNHLFSGNWHEFKDKESGIWAYMWRVGSDVCGDDVFELSDPFVHLLDPNMWTYQGLIRNILMPDGKYYMSVQGINKIIYGGSLVSTVCSPTAMVIDTTAPMVGESLIKEVVYDAVFKALVLYFDLQDPESGIKDLYVGLGRTKHDVEILKYQRVELPLGLGDAKMVGLDNIGLNEGEPTWPRLRATNNVDLTVSGAGDFPIVVDNSPPKAGLVLDGSLMLPADAMWWPNNTIICAQWIDFFDPDTGIAKYLWSVGTAPGLDDVVAEMELSHKTYKQCADVELEHRTTYYSNLVAFNRGLNQGCINASSDGMTVDITAPEEGFVFDGTELDENDKDMKYSSRPATVSAFWNGFDEPESGIYSIQLIIIVNGEVKEDFDIETDATTFSSHTHNHNHLDYIETRVTVTNGARESTTAISDGFLMDRTPPRFHFVKDTEEGGNFQTHTDNLISSWSAEDPETDIKEFRIVLYKLYAGTKERIWPLGNDPPYLSIKPDIEEGSSPVAREQTFTYIQAIQNGPLYTIEVTALNFAGLATIHESEGVRVDSTPPVMEYVKIGELEENFDIDDEIPTILAADPENLQGRWKGRDPESGILKHLVAVGTQAGGTEIIDFIDLGIQTSATLTGLNMPVTEESGQFYYLTVKVENGAGVMSEPKSSARIRMLKANQPGVVNDGAELDVDIDAQFDSTRVAVSFSGFASELCGIVGYKWGISNVPGNSDLLAFTSAGIGQVSDTHHIAVANLDLPENMRVYVDVVAITGHGCHEEMIVSSSNGFWVDVQKPRVGLTMFGEVSSPITDGDPEPLATNINYYQKTDDTLPVRYFVTDAESGYHESTWMVGSGPREANLPVDNPATETGVTLDTNIPIGRIGLEDGDTLWFTVKACDYVPNCQTYVSAPLTTDATPPIILGFTCHQYLSHEQRVLRCNWDYNKDDESGVTKCRITIGTEPQDDSVYSEDLAPFIQSWHRSMEDDDLDVGATYIITLTSYNRVDLEEVVFATLKYDITNPVAGKVYIVTSSVRRAGDPGVAEVSPCEEPRGVHCHVQCQESMTHVTIAWTPFEEEHSVIDKYYVAIGVGDEPTSEADFIEVPAEDAANHMFTVYGIALPSGTKFYATLRVCNKAGLCTTVQSLEVVVSPEPYITLLDGYSGVDTRFTMSESVYEAKWFPSDECPLVSVNWTLVSLDEEQTIQPLTVVAPDEDRLYADQVVLTKDQTYCALLFAEDVLGRRINARSDCVTVYLEKPNPAEVWIGSLLPGSSFKYQEPVTELSCNWAEFGQPDVDEPGQIVDYYEVAIGNDITSEWGKSNIHFFVNVGTNRSHTFRDLGLARKTVAYYCSVRAMSKAQSYTVVSSTQIYAGFRDEMNAAPIYLPKCHQLTTRITPAWDRYDSDFPIIMYFVGLFEQPFVVDDAKTCEENLEVAGDPMMDWVEVRSGSMYEFDSLELVSGSEYWVVVYGYDDAAHCSINISEAVMIDDSPPLEGEWLIGKEVDNVIHIATPDKISIGWQGYDDPESGIVEYKVALMRMPDCVTEDFDLVETVEDYIGILTEDTNDTLVHFEGLVIEPRKPYYAVLSVKNCAGLYTQVWSPPIFLDDTPPAVGSVKDGESFETNELYTPNTTDLFATLTLAHSPDSIFCATTREVSFIDAFPEDWVIEDKKEQKSKKDKKKTYLSFLKENSVQLKGKGMEIHMKQHLGRKEMQGTSILSPREPLYQGNYSVKLVAAAGKEILSRYEVLFNESPRGYMVTPTPDNVVPVEGFNVEENPDVEEFSEDTATVAAEVNETYVPFVFVDPNVTFVNLVDVAYGFGVAISGKAKLSDDETGSAYYALFWVVADGLLSFRWIELLIDPTAEAHEYTFTVVPKTIGFVTLYDLTFSVDGEPLQEVGQLNLGDRDYYTHIFLYPNNEYYPTPPDKFTPFASKGLLERVIFPLPRDQLCHFGDPFYDFESGIAEIWAGIGNDSTTLEANIVELELYQNACVRCIHTCDNFSCDPECIDDDIRDLVQIHFSDLYLPAGEYGTEGTLAGIWIPAQYYIYAKIINRAGLYQVVKTDGIIIDQSPPEFNQSHCIDPWIESDEAALEQASNVSLRAMWQAFDDQSNILEYRVAPAVMDEESGELELLANYTRLHHTVLKHTIEGLSLDHGNTYFYIIVAENGAHLTATVTANISVNIFPPVVDAPPATPKGATPEPAFPEGVHMTRHDDYSGIEWPPEDLEVCFYVDWQLSSKDELLSGNIFPKERVGTGGTIKSIEIDKGKLVITVAVNGVDFKKLITLGEFTKDVDWPSVNTTNGEFEEIMEAVDFKTEMGKCVVHEMFCVGKNRLFTELKPVEVCQRREEDVSVAVPEGQSATLTGNVAGARRKRRQADATLTFSVPPSEKTAAISFGAISEEETLANFDSAPIIDYRPYVVNPNATAHMVSRIMWGRIAMIIGDYFYLSPAGDLWLDAPIKATVPVDHPVGEGEELNLLYWDVGAQQWKHSAESCDKYPTINVNALQVSICQTRTYEDLAALNPPSPRHYPVTATMYSVVVQLDTPQNDPPELESDYLVMLEDEELITQLTHYDTADDQVKWYLHTAPKAGHATVSENGTLFYKPVRDKYGMDTLEVRMLEYGLPSIMTPLESIGKISIEIQPVEDEPYLLILYNHNEQMVFRRNDTDLVVQARVAMENREMTLFGSKSVALIVLFDPDEKSEMNVLFQVLNPETGEYDDVSEEQFILRNFNLSDPFVNSMVLELVYPQTTWFSPTTSKAWLLDSQYTSGVHSFRLLGVDETNRVSTQFQITAGIMQNPCDKGYCAGPEDDPNCTDWRRTESFAGYRCECYEGYSGETCSEGCQCSSFENCIQHTECSMWGVCQEVSYDCVLDMKKVALSAGGGGAAIVVAIFLAILLCCLKFMPKLRKSAAKDDYSDNQDEHNMPQYIPAMFNFFGYGKNDPLYQGHENHGYVPHDEGNVDKPKKLPRTRPESMEESPYRPWFLDAAATSKRVWQPAPNRESMNEDPAQAAGGVAYTHEIQQDAPGPLLNSNLRLNHILPSSSNNRAPAYNHYNMTYESHGYDNQAYVVETLTSGEGGGGQRLPRNGRSGKGGGLPRTDQPAVAAAALPRNGPGLPRNGGRLARADDTDMEVVPPSSAEDLRRLPRGLERVEEERRGLSRSQPAVPPAGRLPRS